MEDTFNSYYLRDLYGTEIPVCSQDMSCFTNIGRADMCIDDFFSLRVNWYEGLVTWDTTNGTHCDLDKIAE